MKLIITLINQEYGKLYKSKREGKINSTNIFGKNKICNIVRIKLISKY
jgi:hypothetical protein